VPTALSHTILTLHAYAGSLARTLGLTNKPHRPARRGHNTSPQGRSKVIGPLIERHRVSLTHSSKSNEWDAQVEIGEDIEFTDATNPRLAVARILIKKTLLENPSNAYTIKLPARTAFAFGLDRDSQSFSVSFLSQGGELDEDEVIFLDITP